MRRPRPLPPDTRPDWRDPDMPVWDRYRGAWMRPGLLSLLCARNLAQMQLARDPDFPDWRDDPTYSRVRRRQ